MLKITTNQEYLEDMTYEELLEERKRIKKDPKTTMYELVYIDILIGEKEGELGYTYSLEEAFEGLISEEYLKYRDKTECSRRVSLY